MNPHPTHKPAILRVGVLLFLIAFGWRISEAATGAPPVVAAAGTAKLNRLLPRVDPAPSGLAYVRVETLTPCGDATQLGLYAPSDPHCQPSQTVSLNWLQSQLTNTGLLAQNEYLASATANAEAHCFATLYTSPSVITGYLCADAHGLYRAAPDGTAPQARFQIWTE